MAGALKTLYSTLKASAFMSGISVVYGEEMIADQSQTLPMVVMVPKGGSYTPGVGYSQHADPMTEMIWGVEQNVDFYLWGADVDGIPIDSVDAVEPVRLALLSALQEQRVQADAAGNPTVGGLWFKPVSERWELMQNAANRFGRSLVISTMAEISVVTALPSNATVTSESISYTVVNKAS